MTTKQIKAKCQALTLEQFQRIEAVRTDDLLPDALKEMDVVNIVTGKNYDLKTNRELFSLIMDTLENLEIPKLPRKLKLNGRSYLVTVDFDVAQTNQFVECTTFHNQGVGSWHKAAASLLWRLWFGLIPIKYDTKKHAQRAEDCLKMRLVDYLAISAFFLNSSVVSASIIHNYSKEKQTNDSPPTQ